MGAIVPFLFGIIALIYAMRILVGCFVRLLPKKFHPLPDELPTLSVVIPCFNEGIGIYKSLKSLGHADYPIQLFDVTVIDDCSTDDSVEWIKKGIDECPHINIKYIVQPQNAGKQHALLTGFHNTTGDIFVLFDSDVIVDPDVFKAFVRELQDPKMGIVGASCGVYDVNTNLISQGYASIFYTLHEWLKQIESTFGCVSVVDGKAMGFRREVYAEMEPQITNRTWLGLHMMAGEDRHITHCLTLAGYKSTVVLERVNTSTPPSLVDLYKQQIRWRRSGLRDLLWVIKEMRLHCVVLGPVKTLILLVGRMYYLLLPLTYIMVIYLTGLTGLIQAHLAFLPFLILIRLIMNVHAWFFQPDQVVKNPILTSIGLAAWMSMDMFFTTMVAFLTMDQGGWGTRNLSTNVTAEEIK